MFNKKHIIIFLALLVACMSIAVAADVDDATISSDVTDAVEADSTTTVQTQAVTSVSEDNNYKTIEKENKTVKQEEYDPVVTSEAEYNDSFENNSLNCVQTRNNMLTKSSVKEVKTDGDSIIGQNYTFKLYSGQYVGAEYNGTLYNNGTLIINITSLNTNFQYDTLKINSQELFTEVKNMVLYIKYSSTMLPKDFGFKLKFDGIDKNNVDLTYIFDNDQYSAKMFDFMLEFKSEFKSTTFENFNLLIRNEINDDEPVYVGIKVNSNVILRNCNIEINLPDSFDEKVIDLSENTLIENCTFTYDVPLIFYFDDSHTDYWEEDGLVFTSTGQGNTTINNNVFIIRSFEKSHDYEAVEYAFGIVVSGENFIFTNNEVNVRYVRPILITSSNAIIENNTITSMDTDYTINITGDNNIVRYNTLTAGENEGDATVIVTGENNIVEQNPYVEVVNPELRINPVEFNVGSAANISASIYLGDDVASDINKGKVTFKINGKTLKDTNGKVIYAKIVNGTATIENYEVPLDWATDGSTIQAVYSGSTQCDKLSSEKTEITVQKTVPTLTTENITATAGNTITLTATITDNNQIINTGKVVFKINGKTVKDANGKVIYAKVVNNQVSVEYTLPEDMKTGTYNITAVFTGSGYDKLEDVKTLTVN